MGFGIVRPEADGPAETGRRLVRLPLVGQHVTETVMGLREIRPENESPAIAGGRFVQPPQFLEHDAQIGMVSGLRGVERDRPTDQVDGQIRASHLIGDHPEQVQAVSIAGVDRQNLPVKPFGFMQASCLMMVQGGGQYRLNARRRRRPHRPPMLRLRPALFAVHVSAA